MANRSPFEIGEWYHCYNRGVDKRCTFESSRDYERFQLGLYVGNSEIPVHLSNLKNSSLHSVLSDDAFDRGEPIVEVGAYSLMPNHFHFVLREITEGGIAHFMQKLCTGYTMYFNKKRERVGALFASTFKSKHAPDDRYLKHLVAYIHLNPAELFDSRWKNGEGNVKRIEQALKNYPYSSLPDLLGIQRPERKLLGDTLATLYETMPTLSEVVDNAHAYHQENIEVKP